MRKIVLKFKIGSEDKPSITNHMIMIVSDLVHVEALFENGVSWSSTQMKDDEDGVRFKEIKYSHPERWKDIVLWVTDAEYSKICMTCGLMEAMNKGYDMRGAIGTAATNRHNPEKFFCSEAVFEAVLAEFYPRTLNVGMHPDKLWEYAEVLAAHLDMRKILMESN